MKKMMIVSFLVLLLAILVGCGTGGPVISKSDYWMATSFNCPRTKVTIFNNSGEPVEMIYDGRPQAMYRYDGQNRKICFGWLKHGEYGTAELEFTSNQGNSTYFELVFRQADGGIARDKVWCRSGYNQNQNITLYPGTFLNPLRK